MPVAGSELAIPVVETLTTLGRVATGIGDFVGRRLYPTQLERGHTSQNNIGLTQRISIIGNE
jgi:hypothetical protein